MAHSKVDVKQINALALAYMGDAVFDKYVRHHLILKGKTKPNHLHKEATKFVSAKAQAVIIHNMLDNNVLMEEEKAVVKRGRNAKSGTIPKNTDVTTYRHSSGFEALLGYLYLIHEEARLQQLLKLSIEIIENGGRENNGQ